MVYNSLNSDRIEDLPMRPDGTRVKDLPPIVAAVPYIMPKRYDAWNSITEYIDEEAIKSYIREKRRSGVRINHMAVIIAAYYKSIQTNPKLNYFVVNSHIYRRNHFSVSFVILKKLADGSPDETTLKIYLEPKDTIFTINQKIADAIAVNSQTEQKNSTDKFAKMMFSIPGLPKKGVHQLFACAVRYPRLHVRMENYARLAMQEDEWYNNLSDESCAMPGTFAVFALGLEGPKWWRLVCDYLDRCDDEHSSLQEKFIHTFFKKYGFTAQSLPVLVHGVQSMQNLKPAKEFRTLIANEESLDALMEIKGHLEYYLPEESGNDKRALAYLWRDVLWAIWGTAYENGGSKVIKTAPKELKEKYQQVFA